jgi:hypothetical protein
MVEFNSRNFQLAASQQIRPLWFVMQTLMLYLSAQAAARRAIRFFRGEVLEWPNRAAC